MKASAPKQWFLALLLVVLAGAALGAFWRRENTLLKPATRIYGPKAALDNDLTYSGYFAAKFHHAFKHYWLTEGRLLLAFNQEHNQLSFRAFKLDLDPRTETALPALERLFDEKNPLRPFLWEVSPDGRFLLTVRTELREAVFAVMDFEGSTVRAWTNRWMNTRPIWLSHSRAFIEQVFDDGNFFARVHRLDSALVPRLPLDIPNAAPPHSFGDDAMAVLPEPSQPNRLELVSFHWGGTNIAMEKFALPVPRKLYDSDWTVFPSPQGDWLVWVAFYRQNIPHLSLQREAPFFRAEPRYAECVWLSRVDGTELRELGRLPVGEEVRRVAWRPDGKVVSFVLREAIWMIPCQAREQ